MSSNVNLSKMSLAKLRSPDTDRAILDQPNSDWVIDYWKKYKRVTRCDVVDHIIRNKNCEAAYYFSIQYANGMNVMFDSMEDCFLTWLSPRNSDFWKMAVGFDWLNRSNLISSAIRNLKTDEGYRGCHGIDGLIESGKLTLEELLLIRDQVASIDIDTAGKFGLFVNLSRAILRLGKQEDIFKLEQAIILRAHSNMTRVFIQQVPGSSMAEQKMFL
jgi:hypothetical protein